MRGIIVVTVLLGVSQANAGRPAKAGAGAMQVLPGSGGHVQVGVKESRTRVVIDLLHAGGFRQRAVLKSRPVATSDGRATRATVRHELDGHVVASGSILARGAKTKQLRFALPDGKAVDYIASSDGVSLRLFPPGRPGQRPRRVIGIHFLANYIGPRVDPLQAFFPTGSAP
jgi:hypothetical protein